MPLASQAGKGQGRQPPLTKENPDATVGFPISTGFCAHSSEYLKFSRHPMSSFSHSLCQKTSAGMSTEWGDEVELNHTGPNISLGTVNSWGTVLFGQFGFPRCLTPLNKPPPLRKIKQKTTSQGFVFFCFCFLSISGFLFLFQGMSLNAPNVEISLEIA